MDFFLVSITADLLEYELRKTATVGFTQVEP